MKRKEVFYYKKSHYKKGACKKPLYEKEREEKNERRLFEISQKIIVHNQTMKKDFVEFLGFTDEELKGKVGRPKLADKETKQQ